MPAGSAIVSPQAPGPATAATYRPVVPMAVRDPPGQSTVMVSAGAPDHAAVADTTPPVVRTVKVAETSSGYSRFPGQDSVTTLGSGGRDVVVVTAATARLGALVAGGARSGPPSRGAVVVVAVEGGVVDGVDVAGTVAVGTVVRDAGREVAVARGTVVAGTVVVGTVVVVGRAVVGRAVVGTVVTDGIAATPAAPRGRALGRALEPCRLGSCRRGPCRRAEAAVGSRAVVRGRDARETGPAVRTTTAATTSPSASHGASSARRAPRRDRTGAPVEGVGAGVRRPRGRRRPGRAGPVTGTRRARRRGGGRRGARRSPR